ncbi:MAG: tetratricopeptide repeat protein [Candidatus Omnitrophica bacterium]|nr:tetratricopeptide repeat protein [Candidatus Omnitrophota bacterium]
MSKKFLVVAFLLTLPILSLSARFSFAGNMGVEYLCELGTTFYDRGRYDDALSEFNKALTVDPSNPTAKKYVDKIFSESMGEAKPADEAKPIEEAMFIDEAMPKDEAFSQPAQKSIPTKLTKEEAIDQELNRLGQKEEPFPDFFDRLELSKKPKEAKYKIGPIAITGDLQLAFGVFE